MGTLPDKPPGARHGSSLSSTTCSPASVDMGTCQELVMGTLHMSVQRANEIAVAAVGLQLAGETLSSRCSYLRGRCVPTKSPLPVRRKGGVLTLDATEVTNTVGRNLVAPRTPRAGSARIPNPAPAVDRPRPDRTRPLASDTGPRQPRRPDERIECSSLAAMAARLEQTCVWVLLCGAQHGKHIIMREFSGDNPPAR